MKTKPYIMLIKAMILVSAFSSCEEIKNYPDEPSIDYKSFQLFTSTDALGNPIALGKLEFDFTDGDGDIGLNQPNSDISLLPDSLKYNLFMQMYTMEEGIFIPVEDTTENSNYRIPFIERTGQNKTLSGTIIVDIEYPQILHDTIYYTFYILDREFHKSNTDTTDILVFTGINL